MMQKKRLRCPFLSQPLFERKLYEERTQLWKIRHDHADIDLVADSGTDAESEYWFCEDLGGRDTVYASSR
jgi:hypothetical protein